MENKEHSNEQRSTDCESHDLDTYEFTSAEKMSFKHPENLVFEGGGMRGIAFGGTLKFMEDFELMKDVKRIAGSSAGGIVAGAVAVGYTSEEIIKILRETDFEKFKDDTIGVIFDVYRFLTQYGFYKGDFFLEWYRNIMKDKTGNPDITFKEVFELGKELVITGTCLNKAETVYFNYKSHPKMPIALAVRISMSIPLVFRSVKLNGDIMVDGGLLNNYPIWVFDGNKIGECPTDPEKMKTSKTLGFKLMTNDETANNTLWNVDEKVNNIIEYLEALINSMSIQIERGHIRSGYWDKTVCIKTGDIGSLMFTLTEDQKNCLIHEGYIATKNHFYCQVRDLPNIRNEITNKH